MSFSRGRDPTERKQDDDEMKAVEPSEAVCSSRQRAFPELGAGITP